MTDKEIRLLFFSHCWQIALESPSLVCSGFCVYGHGAYGYGKELYVMASLAQRSFALALGTLFIGCAGNHIGSTLYVSVSTDGAVSNTGSDSGAVSNTGSDSGSGVTITPLSATLVSGASQYFTCTVAGGEAHAGCTWTVGEANGGTINADGLYVAPATPGTYQVVATSTDSSASATAPVTVVAPVGGCTDVAAAGTWQNITPTQLDFSNWCVPGSSNCTATNVGTYGANDFALDPNNPGTVYLGTAGFGIWKSTNCGSDWVKIDTGQNHAILDSGRQQTFYIDPTNSDTLYAMALYGSPGVQGFYESTNGGVDWTQIIPADVITVVAGGFLQYVAMDTLPSDPKHFVANPHDNCTGTPIAGAVGTADAWGCFAEGTFVNGSWVWTVTTSGGPPGQGDGAFVTMLGPKRWLSNVGGGAAGGLMLTTTGGVPPAGGGPGSAWTQVSTGYMAGCYLASDGTVYCGTSQGGAIYSTDDGSTWTTVNEAPYSLFNGGAMVDDGTTLYLSQGLSGDNYAMMPISPQQPAGAFTAFPMNPPGAAWGAIYLLYDPNYKLLYSANFTGGFWRVVAP
jgi:hypothetical protein